MALARDMHGRRTPPGTKLLARRRARAGEAVRLPERDGVYHLRCPVVDPSLNYEANTIYDMFSASSATRQACPAHNHPSCMWMQSCEMKRKTLHQKYGHHGNDV
jgi:hypothetical protein